VIELTLTEVASAVGGRLHAATGDERVTGTVEFDSRKVGPGGLFVALPGERVDGHDFAGVAVRAGAAGVLAGRPVDAPAVIVPPAADVPGGVYVLAGDRDGSGAAVLAALGRLARAVVDRLTELTVVGVTGSSGKTSTKDLIAALVGPLGSTIAPPGSFNNELGHPWTVLRADHGTRHLVLELSARGVGHIAALCRVAPPRIGVVLNVGSAHLGEFGSRQAIAAAKGELVEALPPADRGGVAVLNADDELVSAMAARTPARVLRFGVHPTVHPTAPDVAVLAEDVELDGSGRASFRLVTPDGTANVRLAVHGRHQVSNALAAAAVAVELGAGVEQVADRLSTAAPVSPWRMEVRDRADGLTVINDAYNANPESVRAALQTLVAMSGTGRRSWAVLGPLGELGERAEAEHAELGRLAVRLGVDRLVVVGEQARAMHDAAGASGAGSSGEESVFVPDVEAAVALLRDELRAGDLVLVKASRAFGLERVATELLAEETLAEDGVAR
jgi:UDP-N-acetylmuramoyl-tripeptide--D-alanyl-D-alanine ligase